ncbi:putative O-linked N-acetylglucosamine transferase (SPINDLY family) [Acidovorax sp. 69]|uniref:tetratricopeptide repeat protein n=1 Tax=Acidovorax sp. 69 TaxID=2035202 RepID=UPI000C239872|nr:tetratricopeptide repeat protein [Acidovorax sp. 69]PJI95595.1 putative O-linked N-acetylglucosamine transferase (SPINDLY family) [Acidovorax sp. 69]
MLAWLKKKWASPHSADSSAATQTTRIASEHSPVLAPVGPWALYLAGQGAAAEQATLAQLAIEPDHADGLLVQGLIALERGHKADSLRILERAASLHPSNAEIHVAFGRALLIAGRGKASAAAFHRALAVDPGHAMANLNLAKLALASGQEEDGMNLLQSAVTRDPSLAEAQFHLGNLMRVRGELDLAEKHYRNAVSSRPDYVDALVNLGSFLKDRGRNEEAVQHLEHALRLKPDITEATFNLAMIRVNQRMWVEASHWLRSTLATDPKQADAQYWLGNASMGLGDAVTARKAYQAALRINANYVQARWGHAMAQLPAVPQSDEEQNTAPRAFESELDKLKAWFRTHRPADGYRAVGAQQPYYLAYIPQDHRAVLSQYGDLCTSLMGTWARKVGVPTPVRNIGSKLKIGIVSAHIHEHSVWRAIVRGWVEHLDPTEFEIHIFHTGTGRDAQTEMAAGRATRFYYAEGDWVAWAKVISDARLNILAYPEIGMDSTTVRLASLRLAPVQLASWGHPITTGLPTMDVFVSAEALEPEAAYANYSEELIELPGIGCCYHPFSQSPTPIDLTQWGIGNADRILLCAGTPFKYAPQNDVLWIDIAKRCQPCKLVFFRAQPEPLTALLEARLRKKFTEACLDFDAHVRFIPWLPQAKFFALLDRADVYLDSVGFSGFNTAMQAIERCTPIVAWDGQFMRGRFASGILRQLELDEWIADSMSDYAALVENLCASSARRDSVRQKISTRRSRLFSDPHAVAAFAQKVTSLGRKI